MNMRVLPARLSGTVRAIPSKSHAHRVLIAAALSDASTRVVCPQVSDDITRTALGLQALCCDVHADGEGYTVTPGAERQAPVVDCADSGSTWRFLLPVAAALGVPAQFQLAGRLPARPMMALYQVLGAHGVAVRGEGTDTVRIAGRLRAGTWQVAGDVSSQFITGLLLAAPLIGGTCRIQLSGPMVSPGYVDITLSVMRAFGIEVLSRADGFTVPAGQRYRTPGTVTVEGDWSNAAFWLCGAAALNHAVSVTGLNLYSPQGDRAVVSMLKRFGARLEVSEDAVRVLPAPLSGWAVDIDATPDLAPALALVGAVAQGETVLHNIGRLRLKESDRAQSIAATLKAFGVQVAQRADSLVIQGSAALRGGAVHSHHDHRIAMMAALLACGAEGATTIGDADAVSKSYPHFFDDLRALGGVAQEVH